MDRVRTVHLRMVDAVLGGDGLEGVAALAAGESGGVVAIVVPRLGAAAGSGPGGPRRGGGLGAGGRARRVAALRGRAPPLARGSGAAGRSGGGADRLGRRATR